MRIAVVTHNYPSPANPSAGAFTRAFVRVMRRSGHTVQVISPVSWVRNRLEGLRRAPALEERSAEPSTWYPSFFHLHRLIPWKRAARAQVIHSYRRAAAGCLATMDPLPDLVYTHFGLSATTLLPISRRLGIPLLMNIGESSPEYLDSYLPYAALERNPPPQSAFITVSRALQETLCQRIPSMTDRIWHLPNGADHKSFHPMPRTLARKKLGLPTEGRLACFTGSFTERKGPLRVLRALESLKGEVKGVFLGQGPMQPQGNLVLHRGAVHHDEMPLWLNACDLFVLPSLEEGMSNAIVEAMACGLPLAVSDRPFNREFLDPERAVLVNPESPLDIAEGMRRILQSPASQERYARQALEDSKALCLESRLEGMLDCYTRLQQRRRGAA